MQPVQGDLMSVRMEDYLAYSGAAWSLYKVLIEPCNKVMTEKKLIIIPIPRLATFHSTCCWMLPLTKK
jgi:hypothetical protein